jgi:hypothetical protein
MKPWRADVWWPLVLFAPPVLLLQAVVAASAATGKPLWKFFNDPATVGGIHPLNGVVSHAGVLIWWAAAVVCLFASALLADDVRFRERRRMFLAAGLLSTILAVDDLFQVHEFLAPRHLGVPEELVFVLYGSIALAFLARFKDFLSRSRPHLLLLAFACFGISVLMDGLPRSKWTDFAENACKLMGIVSWFGYFGREALSASRAMMRSGVQSPAAQTAGRIARPRAGETSPWT